MVFEELIRTSQQREADDAVVDAVILNKEVCKATEWKRRDILILLFGLLSGVTI